MKRSPVKSSFVNSIGYEGGTLEVAFKDGNVYRYEGVPADTYKSVMGAESIGKALKEQVLKGGFNMEKLELETGGVE